nr:N-myc-interactor [Danio rerio]|eukprot:XP_021334738.1 N-myc-interactor [Danio rerio]
MSDSAGDTQFQDESTMSDELQKLKDLIESADNERSRLLLEKAESEKEKRRAEAELERWMKDEEIQEEQFRRDLEELQVEMKNLESVNRTLKKELDDLKDKLQLKEDEIDSLQQKFKIQAELPVQTVKFSGSRGVCEREDELRCVFTVTQRPSLLLRGGQALITFEEDKVAEQILRLAKCSVACDKAKMEVKPCAVTLEPTVKYEVHITVSKKTVRFQFQKAPPPFPAERIRDRLELSFCKANRGGGEVEELHYNEEGGAGTVTFSSSAVAERLVLRGRYTVDVCGEADVEILPVYEYQLRKFQTFSGVASRTQLLKEMQALLDEEDMQDHMEIHFQKPSKYVGEVENIRYVPDIERVTAFFSEDHTTADP